MRFAGPTVVLDIHAEMIGCPGDHLAGSSEPDDAEILAVQFFRLCFPLVAAKSFEQIDEFGEDEFDQALVTIVADATNGDP